MTLIKVITTCVTFKRSLGLHFDSDDRRLRRFCRAMGGVDVNMRDVTPAAVLAYLDGKGPVTAGWGLRFHTLDRFYRFAISRGLQRVHHCQRIYRNYHHPSSRISIPTRSCGG